MPADRRARPLAAGLVLAALLTPVVACTSGSDAAAPSATAVTTASEAAGSTSSSTPSSRASTTQAPGSGPTSTRPSGTSAPAAPSLAPVPSRTRPTQPAQPLTATASFGAGVTVSVVSTAALSVVGRGPGELSGPAVAYQLRLMNRGGSAIDLGDAVVTAAFGTAATPAGDSASEPAAPWRGAVEPGGAATATYVFLVPVAERKSVTLTISYDPRQPVVVLRS